MTEIIASTAFGTTILLSFIVIVFWMIQEVIIEAMRQEMFCLRDEWFDFAANKNISFDDEVYKGFRELVNSMIRYAHKPTLFSVAMLPLYRHAKANSSGVSKYEDLIKKINDLPEGETKKKVMALHKNLGATMAAMLVCRSPVGMIATVIIIFFFLARLSMRKLSGPFSALAGWLKTEEIERNAFELDLKTT
jgi:hypothetical protein